MMIISMPFNVGIGGFYREYKTIPYIVKRLRDYLDEVELYVPYNAVRALYKYYLPLCNSEGCAYECAINQMEGDLHQIEKESNYNLHINEEMIKKILISWSKSAEKPLEKILQLVKSSSVTRSVADRIKQRVIHKNEMDFCKFFSNYFKDIDYIYVTHETVDALSCAVYFARKNKASTLCLLHNPPDRHEAVLLKELVESKTLLALFGVSLASFNTILNYNLPLFTIFPGNAVELDILKHVRQMKKEGLTIYFGRISHEKGIPDLLSCWPSVEKLNSEAILLLVGTIESETLKRKIIKYSSKHRIQWIPPQNREKLMYYVGSSKVFALPSYKEGYSLSILEALTLGVNVVAYSIPAIKLLYQHLPNVMLVDVGDKKRLSEGLTRMLTTNFETNETLEKFLHLHSSWKNVVNAEIKQLQRVICSEN